MKMIVAVIRPEMLGEARAALEKHDVCLTCISQVVGGDREPGYTEIYRGREVRVAPPRLRLEMVVADESADVAVGAILRACSLGDSGPGGAGKVFVLQLDQ
jgi:nitrogen regulatory protein PII